MTVIRQNQNCNLHQLCVKGHTESHLDNDLFHPLFTVRNQTLICSKLFTWDSPGPSPLPSPAPVQICLDLLRIPSSFSPSPNPVQTSQLKGLLVENSSVSKLFLEYVGGLKHLIQYISHNIYSILIWR